MPAATIMMKAGAAIAPAVFVKVSTAADNTVLTAGANDPIIGVSSESAQNAPIPGANANAATAAGEQCMIHPLGSVALVTAGSGGVTRGDELKSDTDGTAITRATTGTTVQQIGAIALESALAGELAKVFIWRTSMRPALS